MIHQPFRSDKCISCLSQSSKTFRDLNLENPESLSILFSFDLHCQNQSLFKYFVEFYFLFYVYNCFA